MVADDRAQPGEMLAHPAERGGLADLLVQGGGARKVAEQHGHPCDADLVAWPQHLVGEQVAEGLVGGNAIGREGVPQPVPFLDHCGQRPTGVIDEDKLAVLRRGAKGHFGAGQLDGRNGTSSWSNSCSGPGSRVRAR